MSYRPSMAHNVNINQLAMPGMEEHSHPGAKHLAADPHLFFFHGQSKDPDTGEVYAEKMYAHTDWEGDRAGHGGKGIGGIQGVLRWAGPHAQPSYPGEVEWVENTSGSYVSPQTPKYPGLMKDMFRMAHQIPMGQSTVPVHSTQRTERGEKFAHAVGPPELVPPRNKDVHGMRREVDWDPPPGIHPYERAGSPRQLAPAMKGQGRLRGVLAHVKKEQHRLDEAELDRGDARLMGDH